MKNDRYFGWFSKSGTVDRGLDIVVRSDPLSEEVVVEFNEIVGAVCQTRPLLIDFNVVECEWQSLERLPEDLIGLLNRDGTAAILNMGEQSVAIHAECERRLSSFLNAASALRDRTIARLKDDASTLERFKSCASSLYDQHFSYRLFYNLRNFSQHHASPFNIIPVSGSGDDGILNFSVTLELLRDDLILRGEKIQPRVRSELKNGPASIALIENAQVYYKCITVLAGLAATLMHPDLQDAIHYERAVRRMHENMPAEATPVLFHGLPVIEDGISHNNKITSFSFEELKAIMHLIAQAREHLTILNRNGT